MQMFAEWFVGIADRRDHQPRLLAYVLNFRIDQDEECRNTAAEALRAAGREMMGERQEDKLLEKIQYGVDIVLMEIKKRAILKRTALLDLI